MAALLLRRCAKTAETEVFHALTFRLTKPHKLTKKNRSYVFLFFFDSRRMSVVLLTTAPTTWDSVVERDPDAKRFWQLSVIIATKGAVLSRTTLSSLCAQGPAEPDEIPHGVCYRIGDGWILRIWHVDTIMGPAGFLNIGPGKYSAPWGIWILFKVDDDTVDDRVVMSNPFCTLDEKQAYEGYQRAKTFTHTISSYNRAVCTRLNIL